MRTLLQRDTEFLNLHIDTGKYMRVTELFSFTRDELLNGAGPATTMPAGAQPRKSSAKKREA